jgi:hypothetical protein
MRTASTASPTAPNGSEASSCRSRPSDSRSVRASPSAVMTACGRTPIME